MRLVTVAEFPPVPSREFDYYVYDADTYCGCSDCHCVVGFGPTPEAALANYHEQMEGA